MKALRLLPLLILAGCGSSTPNEQVTGRTGDRPPRFADAGLGNSEADVSPYQEWNVSDTRGSERGRGDARRGSAPSENLFYTAACAVVKDGKWQKFEIKRAASSAWLGELDRLLSPPLPARPGWIEVNIFVASRQQLGFRNDIPYVFQYFDATPVETKKLDMRVSGSFWQLHMLVKSDGRPLSDLLLRVPYHQGAIRNASEFLIQNGKIVFQETRTCTGASSQRQDGLIKVNFEFPKSNNYMKFEAEVVSNDITHGVILQGGFGTVSGTVKADIWPTEGMFRLSNNPIPTADIGPFKIL